jgi:hypothetical protein
MLVLKQLHQARNIRIGALDSAHRPVSPHRPDERSGREQRHDTEGQRDKKAALVNAKSQEGSREQKNGGPARASASQRPADGILRLLVPEPGGHTSSMQRTSWWHQADLQRPDGRSQTRSAAVPPLLVSGAWAVAAGRVALGLTALARPSVPARPWVGAAADGVAARVFGRALGARDLALGLGALGALQGVAAEPESATAWVAAGALSDALDVTASLASWGELPRRSRWLVVAAAGGAALTGAAGALVMHAKTRGSKPALT